MSMAELYRIRTWCIDMGYVLFGVIACSLPNGYSRAVTVAVTD